MYSETSLPGINYASQSDAASEEKEYNYDLPVQTQHVNDKAVNFTSTPHTSETAWNILDNEIKLHLDNTAKCCGIMAVLHKTYYDVWPWPMTLTTNVSKEWKSEKLKINLMQSSQRTENRDMRGLKFTLDHFRKVHLTLSKCLWNFNFLAVTVFNIRYEIYNIYTRGRCAPKTPLAKKFWGRPNFTLGTLYPEMPLAEKLSFLGSALDPIY